MRFPSRLHKAQSLLTELQLDAFICSNLQDIRYLSGFSGSTALALVSQEKSYLLLDFRYLEQADQEVDALEVVPVTNSAWDSLIDSLRGTKISRLGFSPTDLSLDQYLRLKEKAEGFDLLPIRSLIGRLRMIKGAEEMEALRRSASLLSQILSEIISLIRPGMKENEIAALFEYSLKMNGSEGPGFETIVASGPRSAMPHAHPSQRSFKTGEFLKIDGGNQWDGYHSDITRTMVWGASTFQQREIYQIVLEAHDQAISAAKPGMTGGELDGIARGIIERAGYGQYFGHGTGHGIGLSIHEEPRISKASSIPLEAGMTFTIEPGIYLPGVGGIRIEDSVLLTESGIEVLTKATREMSR